MVEAVMEVVVMATGIVWRAYGKQSMGVFLRQLSSIRSEVNRGICLEQK